MAVLEPSFNTEVGFSLKFPAALNSIMACLWSATAKTVRAELLTGLSRIHGAMAGVKPDMSGLSGIQVKGMELAAFSRCLHTH